MDGVALVAVISAIVTGIIAVRKLGPERDSLFITSAQGAAVIMDNLISTLREEVDRERTTNAALAAQVEQLTDENDRLKAANAGLRRRGGTRRDDT